MRATPRFPPNQAAYVLHRYDWSESSLILDVFARESGRLAVVAKGAKRPYSQLRSALLPFQRIQLGLTRAKTEEVDVHTLKTAEWAGNGAVVAGPALFSAFYLNELLMKLLARQDPHPRLFDFYDQSVTALAAVQGLESALLRAFELAMLSTLGLLPDLSTVTTTQSVLASTSLYSLDAEGGLVSARTQDGAYAEPGAGLPGAVWLALQEGLQASDLLALQAICAPYSVSLKSQLRSVLQYHLGSAPLRTRKVALEAQRLLEPPRATGA